MPREIEPYRQGDLDSLCGIHAIINALYLLFPEMKEREAQRLFEHVLEEMARKKPNALQIAWRGMEPSLLRHLLVFAANLITKERSVALDVSRPFAKRPTRLATFVRKLREHASQGGVTIISMRGKSLHWTVVSSASERKIRLFDSSERKSIPIRKCALNSGKRFRIHASETVFLRKVEEQ